MDDVSLVGTWLGGYELLERIRPGSIGDVYEAQQPSLKRRVGLRVLRPTFCADDHYRSAFLREAEILGALEHPHIIPVHDSGVQDGIPYIVMRLMKGGLLEERIQQEGGLSLQETAAIIGQIGGALEYVHAAGYTHGPTPRNIIFDHWGSPYLVGFMNANLPPEAILARGSRAYAPPERWLGQPETPATDQYALASTAYTMLTGHTILGDALNLPGNLLYRTPPQSYNPDVPLAVNAVFDRALARKPDERYPTVMDFSREFAQALRAVPQHVFISYSRRDKEYARQLAEYLRRGGFKVWIDDQIDYGDAWFREINEAIKSCAAFALLMSPDSEQSEWVQKEILLAKRYKRPIFPLLLSGEEFPIVIDIQFADVRGGALPDTDFYRRLRRAVYGEG
jgi:serine/threonine protein kinase